MNKCTHCGSSIDDNQTVCYSCGCKCTRNVTVRLMRKKAFTGCLAAMDVKISGDNFYKKVVLSNGGLSALEMDTGKYIFDVDFGGLKKRFEISITKSTSFLISVKTGMFSNQLQISEI